MSYQKVTVDKSPAIVNFKYRRGDTVAEPFTILEGGVLADLTGRIYRAQLRKPIKNETFLDFTVTMPDPQLGEFVIRLTADQTIDLSGTYAWDLEQETSGGVIRTLIAGDFIFDPDVTRD